MQGCVGYQALDFQDLGYFQFYDRVDWSERSDRAEQRENCITEIKSRQLVHSHGNIKDPIDPTQMQKYNCGLRKRDERDGAVDDR